MEQLSKFSRIVWMTIVGLILLKIGLIFWNPAGTFGGILPFCMEFAIFVLLGGWFAVLHRNSKRRSPLHQPALIGIIAAVFMSIVLIVQMVNTLDWDPTVYSINQIGRISSSVLCRSSVFLQLANISFRFWVDIMKASLKPVFIP